MILLKNEGSSADICVSQSVKAKAETKEFSKHFIIENPSQIKIRGQDRHIDRHTHTISRSSSRRL